MVIAQSSLEGDTSTQAIALCVIGVLVSILIYGLVAILVKVDDFGLHLTQKNFKKTGLFLINLMPKVMRGLGVVGTIAMFIVGGGIFSHHFHLDIMPIEIIQNLFVGVVVGGICLSLLSAKSLIIIKK